MAYGRRITIPFERAVSELNLPARGLVPEGAFLTVRPQAAPGWDQAGLRVPAISLRRARILYNRGIIGLPPKPQSEIHQHKKKKR